MRLWLFILLKGIVVKRSLPVCHSRSVISLALNPIGGCIHTPRFRDPFQCPQAGILTSYTLLTGGAPARRLSCSPFVWRFGGNSIPPKADAPLAQINRKMCACPPCFIFWRKRHCPEGIPLGFLLLSVVGLQYVVL